MANGFELSVSTAEQKLEQSEGMTAFILAYQENDRIQAIKGNQPPEGDPSYVSLIAHQIRSIAKDYDIPPIVIGHLVTQMAVMDESEQMRHNFDEYLDQLEKFDLDE